MSRTSNFAHQLVRSLRKKTDDKWRTGKPPSKSNRECVDVERDDGTRLVLIEVELRRTAPVANIVKIWKWLDKDAKGPFAGRKVTVIQAFSSFYDGQKSFLRDNAEFLGRQLARRYKGSVKYVPIRFTFKPYKKRATASATQGGGAMLRAAENLADEIAISL